VPENRINASEHCRSSSERSAENEVDVSHGVAVSVATKRGRQARLGMKRTSVRVNQAGGTFRLRSPTSVRGRGRHVPGSRPSLNATEERMGYSKSSRSNFGSNHGERRGGGSHGSRFGDYRNAEVPRGAVARFVGMVSRCFGNDRFVTSVTDHASPEAVPM
jgi:hypothetical protein